MKAGTDGGGCFPTGRHYPGIAHLMRVVTVGLDPAFEPSHGVLDLPLVCIDTETTGRDTEQDRVVELGCVFFREGAISERLSWLLNPGRPIPQESIDVHGIRDQDVEAAPPFGEVAPAILGALAGAVPVAYNAEFDRKSFLLAELRRADALGGELPPAVRDGVEWLDPLVWARELQKDEKSRSLSEVCGRLGIEMGRAHEQRTTRKRRSRCWSSSAGTPACRGNTRRSCRSSGGSRAPTRTCVGCGARGAPEARFFWDLRGGHGRAALMMRELTGRENGGWLAKNVQHWLDERRRRRAAEGRHQAARIQALALFGATREVPEAP